MADDVSSTEGTQPATIDPRLRDGIVVVDKPMGPSSHQVSAWARDALGVSKAGHGGTLDPRVTGVLIVLLEDATRGVPAIMVGDKEYIGVMRFHHDVTEEAVREMAATFTGRILQFPPVKSAVQRRLRARTIHEFEVIEVSRRDALFRVRCESGTYVRTLARDVGRAIGTGAHLQELRRTRSCSFSVEDAVTLHDIVDAVHFWRAGDGTALDDVVLPFSRLFDHIPSIVVKDSAVDALCHGARLMAPGIVSVPAETSKGDTVVVRTARDEVVGLGTALMDSNGLRSSDRGQTVRLDRVFMRPGTYHSVWKVNR